jgi:hypothetical protein
LWRNLERWQKLRRKEASFGPMESTFRFNFSLLFAFGQTIGETAKIVAAFGQQENVFVRAAVGD